MKKNKAIICFCMALTILCGSSLTAFASETVETEETMETETVEDEKNIFYDGTPVVDENGNYKYFYRQYRYLANGISVVLNYEFTTAEPVCLVAGDLYESDKNTYMPYIFTNSVLESGKFNQIFTVDYTVREQIHTDNDGTVTTGDPYGLSVKLYQIINGLEVTSDTFATNIPVFGIEENARNYLENGDDSGVMNRPPVPEEDETFTFVDFECNEYVSATWNGTTLDDEKDSFDNMGFEINVAYAYDNSFQIAVNEMIVSDGDISANGWSRMAKALQHEDETLYLRAVSFTPYYEKYGQICRGKSEIIWLKMDGGKDYLPNDELTMIEDSSFYLRGVSVENSYLGLVDGDVRSYISWSGTTKDDMIVKMPLDKTYADILCLCYTPTYKITYVDLYELDSEFMGGKPLPLRKALNDSTQAFYINYTDIDETATAQGLNFGGKLYITPYFFYEPDNAIYKGAVTVIDILDNEIEKNPDTGDIYVPDISATPTPSANPSASPDIGESDDILDDDLDFEKALPTFWKMLKSLWASMGQFPELMYSLFPYLPKEFYYILGIMLIGVIIFRFIGR